MTKFLIRIIKGLAENGGYPRNKNIPSNQIRNSFFHNNEQYWIMVQPIEDEDVIVSSTDD